ncbi:unnamed protein product, partial [Amoebophrya sp. A120]
ILHGQDEDENRAAREVMTGGVRTARQQLARVPGWKKGVVLCPLVCAVAFVSLVGTVVPPVRGDGSLLRRDNRSVYNNCAGCEASNSSQDHVDHSRFERYNSYSAREQPTDHESLQRIASEGPGGVFVDHVARTTNRNSAIPFGAQQPPMFLATNAPTSLTFDDAPLTFLPIPAPHPTGGARPSASRADEAHGRGDLHDESAVGPRTRLDHRTPSASASPRPASTTPTTVLPRNETSRPRSTAGIQDLLEKEAAAADVARLAER